MVEKYNYRSKDNDNPISLNLYNRVKNQIKIYKDIFSSPVFDKISQKNSQDFRRKYFDEKYISKNMNNSRSLVSYNQKEEKKKKAKLNSLDLTQENMLTNSITDIYKIQNKKNSRFIRRNKRNNLLNSYNDKNKVEKESIGSQLFKIFFPPIFAEENKKHKKNARKKINFYKTLGKIWEVFLKSQNSALTPYLKTNAFSCRKPLIFTPSPTPKVERSFAKSIA